MEPLLAKSEFTNSRKLRNLLGLSAVYACFLFCSTDHLVWHQLDYQIRIAIIQCGFQRQECTLILYLTFSQAFRWQVFAIENQYNIQLYNIKCNLPFVFLSGNRYKSQFHACLFFPTPTPGSNLSSYNCCYHKSSFGEEEKNLGVAFYQRGSGSWGVVWLS